MRSLITKFSVCLLLFGVQWSRAVCQETDKERLVVFPFEIRGLSAEDGLRLKQEFTKILSESGRFDVMPDNVLRNNLDLAGLGRMDSCNTLPCLAQLGKILSVGKVVHVSVDQWKERYVLHIRLVRSDDAALLYDERVDYAGEFENLRSVTIPDQARKLSAAYLDRQANWYLITAAIIIGIGLIYWLYATLTSTSSSEGGSPNSIPSPQ